MLKDSRDFGGKPRPIGEILRVIIQNLFEGTDHRNWVAFFPSILGTCSGARALWLRCGTGCQLIINQYQFCMSIN